MKTLTKQQLLNALKDIVGRIETDDSFEGGIDYAASKIDNKGELTFDVNAFWRVGNSGGQGGSNMI